MKKTAIVTGGYGAIGKAIAEGLARQNYRVYLISRDAQKLQAACRELILKTGNQDVFYHLVDLSSKKQIAGFINQWNEPLHLLVNNAATGPGQRIETEDGIETQWAVNVLSYFRLTEGLQKFMPDHENSRIVNVASYWAGGLDLKDPEFKSRRYDNDAAYRQSKQSNRMLTVVHAEQLNSRGILVNSCHPGDVNSKLSNSFGFGGHETPAQGAATPLYLALSNEIQGITGKYFEHRKQVNCSFSQEREKNNQLYELCAEY